jgi:hypothetical protein
VGWRSPYIAFPYQNISDITIGVNTEEHLTTFDETPTPTSTDMETVVVYLIDNAFSDRQRQPGAKKVIKKTLRLRQRYLRNTSGETRALSSKIAMRLAGWT